MGREMSFYRETVSLDQCDVKAEADGGSGHGSPRLHVPL